MAIPVGAHGTAGYNPKAGKGSSSNKRAIREGKRTATSFNRNRGADLEYLNQLRAYLSGGGFGGGMGGGFRGGGGGGGGGGGYGGPSAYEKWQIAQEEKRRRELEARKAALTKQLRGARSQALPLLQKYGQQYRGSVDKTFAQNRAQNAGYGRDLSNIARQMNAGMRGQSAGLATDLRGQGAGSPELLAMQQAANMGMQGTDFLNQNAQAYNTRLAQVMAAAQADARNMGTAINTSARGNLENSYANLLAEIGMIGLA